MVRSGLQLVQLQSSLSQTRAEQRLASQDAQHVLTAPFLTLGTIPQTELGVPRELSVVSWGRPIDQRTGARLIATTEIMGRA